MSLICYNVINMREFMTTAEATEVFQLKAVPDLAPDKPNLFQAIARTIGDTAIGVVKFVPVTAGELVRDILTPFVNPTRMVKPGGANSYPRSFDQSN